MRTGKPVFYWDTAPLLAWIIDEKRDDPSEMDGLAEVVELVDGNKATLMTSVLWRSEILRGNLTNAQARRLKEAFEYRSIHEVGIDNRIMDLAGEIRTYHAKQKDKAKLKNVRVPDAIHLATAIHHGVTEFHTFDGKKINGATAGLVTLDGNVAGHRLKICSPRADQLRLDFGDREDDSTETPDED